MAKLLDSKVATADKLAKNADKVFIAALKACDDAATLDTIINRVVTHYNVLRQTADGKGKRFSGAKSHNFADQLAAVRHTFTVGNMLTHAGE